ncbi:hypothetical protein WA026_020364 [Henosepilachna vigintioctopunctata]|uniref:Uncharacterized protein n=1 Tax=Henosepilachna vigintioctopunctata TaxID=420089 RepID=A0AAW1UP09_9CUCU
MKAKLSPFNGLIPVFTVFTVIECDTPILMPLSENQRPELPIRPINKGTRTADLTAFSCVPPLFISYYRNDPVWAYMEGCRQGKKQEKFATFPNRFWAKTGSGTERDRNKLELNWGPLYGHFIRD